MNRELFAALKPGGMLVIADHSARAGDGRRSEDLHRIEESALVPAAGDGVFAGMDLMLWALAALHVLLALRTARHPAKTGRAPAAAKAQSIPLAVGEGT